MSSRFRQRQTAKREALYSKLVSVFLPGIEASDPDNFGLAAGFVAQNLAEPALDVNPRTAEDWLLSFRPTDDLFAAADLTPSAVRAAVQPLLRGATAVRRLDIWVGRCLQRHGASQQQAHSSSSGSSERIPEGGGGAGGRGGKGPAAPRGSQRSLAAGAGSGLGAGAEAAAAAAARWGVEAVAAPPWLLQAAGVWGRGGGGGGGGGGAGVVVLLGPTLQALHQTVSTCLHALRAPLVELEQRIMSAVVTMSVRDKTANGGATAPSYDQLPSLYGLLMACQPVVRRASGLVSAYLGVAKPLVLQAAATAATGPATGPATVPAAAEGALTARLRGAASAAQPGVGGGGGGGGALPAGPDAPAPRGSALALAAQSGLVLERLHSMNESGWLDGVFRPLESHAHRCMLLHLYLSALGPTLDGLGGWLWASGTAPAAPPSGAGGAGSGSGSGSWAGSGAGSASMPRELPADFFIQRGGGGAGKEVPPDHPAFWREGYQALTRPSPIPTTTTTAPTAPAPAATPRSRTASETGGAAATAATSNAAGPAGSLAVAAPPAPSPSVAPPPPPSYLCPPFLEPLVPAIMAAGKSLRLRQREADGMEAAAGAHPGYGTSYGNAAGSAVLDPVALEESYALYGVAPYGGVYGTSGRWGGGGTAGGGGDLKRGLMERLMPYVAAAPSAAAAAGGAAAAAAGAAAWAPGMQGGGVGGGGGGTAAGAHGPPACGSGLWERMASASARLRALCLAGGLPGEEEAAAPERHPQHVLSAAAAAAAAAGPGPGTGVPSSPTTPLDYRGGSAASSPGGGGDGGGGGGGVRQEGLPYDDGGGGGGGWAEGPGDWWPSRCGELLRQLQPAASLDAAAAAGGGRPALEGPWPLRPR
ncbi:hypothetical protein TSOC_010612 [Tetrabaena socialis]|uniref:Uncharacterized protein n=1 Tax=Tetrabaena socialis TaxID=47790 RepID=A0A2J7ZSV6_9CHLO|nr:hypothetical protein TSOC_010612 [Tetrabaena socialis]|eukprot:PNH03338.1 hypothetical protein TSOC_010612 [Tetrabaena socialis]